MRGPDGRRLPVRNVDSHTTVLTLGLLLAPWGMARNAIRTSLWGCNHVALVSLVEAPPLRNAAAHSHPDHPPPSAEPGVARRPGRPGLRPVAQREQHVRDVWRRRPVDRRP